MTQIVKFFIFVISQIILFIKYMDEINKINKKIRYNV